MTLTEIRYIVAVAKEKNFGRAAESCHVSQPTLSVAIKKLEDELGVLLFERSKTNISLTPVGEKILAQSQQLLEQAELIRKTASAGQNQLAGPLRVGAIYTIGPYLFPYLIPAIHKAAPDMPLVIEENYTARLSQHLKQGELDAIIIALPFELPGVVSLPLYEEPFIVVLPASHTLCEKEKININDLSGENLMLLSAGHCFRDQVLAACPDCIHTSATQDGFQQTIEGSSLETIRHMVASGIGITVLPATAAGADRYSQRMLAIRRFKQPVPKRVVALAWRSSFPRPRAIEALRKAILSSSMSSVKYL